jgi:oligopeptide transport system permease protein
MAATNVAKLKTKQTTNSSLLKDAWGRLLRNRAAMLGLITLVIVLLIAIFADGLAPYDYDKGILADTNTAPRWVTQLLGMRVIGEEGGYVKVNENYFFGTDDVGRDILSRLIYGTRVSLMVAIVGPLVSIIVGLLFGMIAGYAGGRTDEIMMRAVDVMYAFPTMLLIIMLMAFFRSTFAQDADPNTLTGIMGRLDRQSGGMLFIFIGIGLTSWMQMARLTRGQVLSIRQREFILAAQSLGQSTPRIMLLHILPNIMGPLIVAETLTIPTYISFEAFLSFIGLGVNPPTPSWGAMISSGSAAINSYPHLVLFPALALFVVMFAFNFLGDGLRDAFDPRMRGVE